MKKKLLGLMLVLLMLLAMTTSAMAASITRGSGQYTITLTVNNCASNHQGIGIDYFTCDPIYVENESMLSISFDFSLYCSDCYRAGISTNYTRVHCTVTRADTGNPYTGSFSHNGIQGFLSVTKPETCTHAWQPDNDGTHSCTNTGCTEQNVPCALTTTPCCDPCAYCVDCGKGYTDPNTHQQKNLRRISAVPAMCEADGRAAYWVCSYCCKYYADNDGVMDTSTAYSDPGAFDTPATDHAWGTPRYTWTDVQGNLGGYDECIAERVCGNDSSHVETEIASGSSQVTQPQTCTAPEQITYTATFTNSVFATQIKKIRTKAALGHDMTFHAEVPATCVATGTKEHHHCANCNKDFADAQGQTELTDLVLARDFTNHEGETEIHAERAANCHEGGYTGTLFCQGCHNGIAPGQDIPIDPTNHDGAEELRDGVTATCHSTGHTGNIWCMGCETIKIPGTETAIDPTYHHGETKLREVVTATCHSKGNTGDTWCLGCETIITPGTETEIDPTNHDGETELRDVKEPTLTEEGYTGDLWCLGCETIIEAGEPIPMRPMEYWVMNVCSIGPRLRNVSDATDAWFMFTPIDLSIEGEQVFDLIAGNTHKVGKVTVLVKDGMVTITCDYASYKLWTRDEFLSILPDIGAATEEALVQSAFAFGQPISIADDLGGDTKVLLVIRNGVTYPVVTEFHSFRDDADYQQLVEDLLLLMD